MNASEFRQAPPTGSRVYVLRAWHEWKDEPRSWRAVVRHGEGHSRHFASLDTCIEHLRRELSRR